MGLPIVGSNSLIIPLLYSYSKVEEGEDSQRSRTDNKISIPIFKCEICFEHKIFEKMQRLLHAKYQIRSDDIAAKCHAHLYPLYCKDCVIQLRAPKRCPRCRDNLVVENTSMDMQAQPIPFEENQQVNIPIHDPVQEHAAAAAGQEENQQVDQQSLKCSRLCLKILFYAGFITLVGVVPNIIETYV